MSSGGRVSCVRPDVLRFPRWHPLTLLWYFCIPATYCPTDDEALLMNSVGSHKEHLSSHEDTHPPPKYYSQSAALSLWRPTLTDRHEGEAQSDGLLWSSKSAGITRVCRWVCVRYWPVSPTLDPFIWIFEAMNAHFRGYLHFLGNLESKIKCRLSQRWKSFGLAMPHVC